MRKLGILIRNWRDCDDPKNWVIQFLGRSRVFLYIVKHL